MKPREFFPNMPDEVFDMWLAPFIEKIGWPFTDVSADLSGTRWNILLGEIPLYVWNRLAWSRVDLEFTKLDFTFCAELAIESIVDNCVHGLTTGTENLQNTKERFWACAEFIRVHQTIPKPIVAIYKNKKIEVMDGNHRIAALRHIGVPNGYWVPTWLPITHPVNGLARGTGQL
ncbi:MAG: hypothetical protein ACREJN_08825 [Nitrospiraceae bacterium]